MENKNNETKITLPCGEFCYNCTSCIYWNPRDRRDDGRTYCENFGSYFYPDERNGCFRYKD